MEIDGGEEEKSPPEAWKKAAEGGGETSGGNVNSSNSEKPKRKMKTPYQLEVLEQTYAVDNYPSEALRAELSVKIGLTDRQLQMWFCHRRLKDRKFPPPAKKARKEEEAPVLPPPPMPPQPVGPSSEIMMAGSSSASPFSSSGEPRRAGVRPGAVMGMGKRYYEPPPIMAPPPISPMVARAIASVEAQLGEPLREDGPILGMEFDPLPPGAFGAPIAVAPHHKQPMRPYSGKLFERHEPKTVRTSFMPSMEHSYMPSSSSGKRKAAIGGAHVVHPQASSRALHEYQFLPEQPSIRSETYEKLPQSHFYDSVVSPNTRASPLQAGGHYLHGNEPVLPTYTFQGQLSNANVVPQGRQQIFSPGSAEYNAPHSNSLTNNVTDAQFGMHPVLGSDSAYLPSDRRMLRDEDSSRVEKKRKSEEARIQKEVEAHEKRIRKELEKQDILRRKREEQMRKEMERHDRERRKEEERLLREKQREEERLLREQRRENERREKFLQKETLRAEKMRQKEEQRREKELARVKAANERATARRIAREYLELIEDERLELMELAASNKGLSSIISLDSETLEQLDLFRDMLSLFPPKSVPLKRPFPNLHWTSKEENIGNFLMVWKFLITFADILGLWPFTIDEFLQSLHDYDSKLLGEIHVALLKSIIKDIEDVARTPAIALGANQNSAANPGGGHPQIVEGAYAWGFDIRSWQLHLNLITWPEILRQLAISAGLGPQLKKRNVERPYFRDDNEGNDGEDVISTLRNGAAAENAAALMHERGYSNRRRSRHRLTPGTVKFAAFHVLSLEGSKGLTILEVAERIQKSGLRDLTTSKTPEASIAAALSRDTKLFERTAPSTYCVRTPYRKDPADADTILSAAREKIQVFQNGLSDSEEAEKDADFVEEAERDEDSECDGADDPEIDDASTDAKLTKDVLCSDELKDSRLTTSLRKDKNEALHASGLTQGNSLATAGKSSPALPLRKSNLISLSNPSQLVISSPSCQGVSNADVEDTETNEINYAETWVQGLSEGDYSDLSVEERLNALVALIGVATEGNSIRVILEERLEAANTLKKQMWAEAQLDKRRFKEEYMSKIQYSSFMGSKAESSQANTAAEGSQTPPEIIDNKDNGGNPITIGNDQFLYPECQSNFNMSADKNLLGQEYSTNPDSAPLQQHGYAAEKSRSQLKSYIGHKAEQHYVYRSLPLGQDRRRNRYWMFSTTTSPNDPGSGRIFFESKDGLWRLIDTEEAFDALLAALDTRGVRESQLHSMLQRIEPIFKESIRRNRKQSNSDDLFATMGTWADMSSSPDCHAEIDNPTNTLCGLTSDSVECSGSFRIGLCRNEREKKTFLKRYKAFLKWMWKESYGPSVLCAMKYGKKRCDELLQACHSCFHCYLAEERHCPSCHKTFKAIHNADAIFSDHFLYCEARQNIDSDWYLVTDSLLPIGLQLLKALLSLMEASIPGEALQPFWTDGYRKSWGVKLHSSTSAEDVLQLVTLLESAVKRDCLSSNYETTNELLGSSTPAVVENNTAISGLIPLLPWVPDSSAAVALRILDLDSSVSYILHQKLESNKEKEAGYFVKPPSRFTVVKNVQELEPTEYPEQVDYQREMRWPDPGSGRRGRGGRPRGRGGRPRGRGGRGLRGINIYAREFNQENVGNYEKATRKYTRRGGRTRGRGRKRGRRSVRPRQKAEGRDPVAKDPHPHLGSFTNVRVNFKQDSFEESPKSYGGNYWGLEEPTDYAEERRHNEYDDQEDSAGSQSDENGLLSGDDEYDDRAETSNYIMDYGENKPMGMMDEESDDAEDDVDGDDDDDGDEDDDEDERVRIGHGVGHGVGHRMMDDDDDDDDDDEEEEDMGDEDGEDIGPDVNGDDEDDDDYSSEYSD